MSYIQDIILISCGLFIKDTRRKLNTFTVFHICSDTHPIVHGVSMCCEMVPIKHSFTLMNDVWGCWVIFLWQVVWLWAPLPSIACALYRFDRDSYTAWWLNFELVVQMLQTRYQVGWPPGQLLTGQLVIKLSLFPWAGHLTSSCSCGIVRAISVL